MDWEQGPNASSKGLSADSPGPYAAAHAYSDKAFFSLGGSYDGDDAESPDTVISGLVVHDFAQGTWDNYSTASDSQTSRRTQAHAELSPNFGLDGFLVVIGVAAPATAISGNYEGRSMVVMSAISLYDIANKAWFVQTATGDVPPIRSEFCAVGSPSDHGKTFEIFIFGGAVNTAFDLASPDDEGYKDVYVLSLPAFRWIKANATVDVRRASHTCSVVGKRQMISIGGRLPSSRRALGREPDPWSSGIGIFDMTLLRWQDHYDADAEKYDTPDPVKHYYTTSYEEPSWINATLASVFKYTGERVSSGEHVPNEIEIPGERSIVAQASTLPVSVIVGAIVGAVLAIVMLCGTLLLLRRRAQRTVRTRRQLPGVRAEHEWTWALSGTNEQPKALMLMDSPIYEVDGNSRASELLSPSPLYTRAGLPGK